jgi:hypothetical protein
VSGFLVYQGLSSGFFRPSYNPSKILYHLPLSLWPNREDSHEKHGPNVARVVIPNFYSLCAIIKGCAERARSKGVRGIG